MLKTFSEYKNKLILLPIVFILITPILTVFSYLLHPSTELWGHLANNLLSNYLSNTLIIVFSVAFITLLIGVSSAWLVAMYKFPGKDIFKWLLVMPIAISTYVSAYIYAGLVEPSGLLFNFADNYLGLGEELYRFADLRNIYGVIFILSICLYPYVYLLCYSSFKEQSYCILEVGRSMGLDKITCFRKISLPLARPGIVAGLSFVIMETLAEFGTVDYYGVSTFTTGIFRTWFSLGDETSALHLASLLLTFVFVIIVLEKFSRGKSQYIHTSQKSKPSKPKLLNKKDGFYAFFWCLIISAFGFIIPIAQLIAWFLDTYSYIFENSYVQLLWNTTVIASISSLLIVVVSIYFSYLNRSIKDIVTNISLKLFSLGYSIPGIVIAIGIMIPVTFLDELQSNFFGEPIFYLSGSFVALIIAYLVRFSTISFVTTEAGLSKIKNNIDLTARSFGLSKFSIIKNIHIPMMKTTIMTALILVFVDIVKELPATLILRPFNFDTLSINIYELASAEQLSYIASPALLLIIIGLIPVIILTKKTINNGSVNFET
jgi:iron(III) transport system permease protein